jgi:hypothetical protein
MSTVLVLSRHSTVETTMNIVLKEDSRAEAIAIGYGS